MKALRFALVFCAFAGFFRIAGAAGYAPDAREAIKLPYQEGQSFIVVEGYDSPPTHVGKDNYAIDFSQNGCGAYGKIAVAASAGKVLLAEENGYNGGYGTQVLIDNGENVLTRYAHLISGTIPFASGETIAQGSAIGAIGDTGRVAGMACPTHPGTHIHFAMYDQDVAGKFAAHLPEPISRYTNITEGNWYVSDNGTEQANMSADISAIVKTETVPSTSSPSAIAKAAPPLSTDNASNTLPLAPAGGVSATPPAPVPITAPSPPELTEAPPNAPVPTTTPNSFTANAVFNSSTLSIDLDWTALKNASGSTSTPTYEIFKIGGNASGSEKIGETSSTDFSYLLADSDFGTDGIFSIQATDTEQNGSTLATATAAVPNWFTEIQPDDGENSDGSWYDDNWYNLGTGFYGLVRELTLEGAIDSTDYSASHLWLDEYLDADYTQLNQTFMLSDAAPLTNDLQKFTIANLNIPLQPNKYYRLRTYEDYQNRSVILAGTSATGTAMWDEFKYGTGRVEHQYLFYPYVSAIMIPNYPPLAAPGEMATATIAFDSLNSEIRLSWPPAYDPDTTSSLLTYEVNIATSSALAGTGWRSVGKQHSVSSSVVFGNLYTIGLRAVDDFGNIGPPSIESWRFPADYTFIPPQLDHSVGLPAGAQKIIFSATTTVSAIAFWTAPGGGPWCCSESFVSIRRDASGTAGDSLAASEPVRIGYLWHDGEEVYNFESPVTLPAGPYWFSVDYGPTQWNQTTVLGSPLDTYPDGEWSTAPGQDAYFRLQE